MTSRLFIEILVAQAHLLTPGEAATRHGRWRAAARVLESLAQHPSVDGPAVDVCHALERSLLDGDARALLAVVEAFATRLGGARHTLLQLDPKAEDLLSVNFTRTATESR